MADPFRIAIAGGGVAGLETLRAARGGEGRWATRPLAVAPGRPLVGDDPAALRALGAGQPLEGVLPAEHVHEREPLPAAR